MNHLELLAPSGDLERLKIACLYGADAIYIGGQDYSLRANALNFSLDDIAQAVKFAHNLNKKVYVALNIFAWDEKYDEIIKAAKELNEIKPDGIIASDGGVIEILKEYAPDIEIHISTQANVISYHNANFWYHNGAKRVIVGREMNKEQIREMRKHIPKDMEIETFCHGAICFGYSGRCFLSDFLCGRSANLGDCAQSCRWAYNIYVEETNKPGNLMPVETDEHTYSHQKIYV